MINKTCKKLNKEWDKMKRFSKMGGWELLANAIAYSQTPCPICGKKPPPYPIDKKDQLRLTP